MQQQINNVDSSPTQIQREEAAKTKYSKSRFWYD